MLGPDRRRDSWQGYHRFVTEYGGQPYGSFEVFYIEHCEDTSDGWYWWSCFPGCMPDSQMCGPFETSQAAFDDAMGISHD